MPQELSKAYDPTAIEDRWAERWLEDQIFAQRSGDSPAAGEHPSATGRSAYTLLLPPPNVTGRLHMGHMLNQTEMDILARWQRMLGEHRVLWVPGTDHAGIATQMMVERQLASEGLTRDQLGRDAFLERVWEWKKLCGGAILDQMKRLGASVDWSREYFTMDENLSRAVREAFVRLHEQGLIYRGAYIVNWCPRCQTAISDLEVVHEDRQGKIWEIRYPLADEPGASIVIATTRPETMLGDVAVVVHPDDERYVGMHGKQIVLPLTGRIIPIITDEWVSREFGTGAVKVTPAHDPNDFALGQRHHLPSLNVMDDQGRISLDGSPYSGLDRYAARERILADLRAEGLLVAEKDHALSVGICDRCKTVVEPRLSKQWFLKIKPLAERAIAAVEQGAIRFTPDQYRKIYLNWMTNIHDWCLSRQLWWGHRIPAWECGSCRETTVARETPQQCTHCGSAQMTQVSDVLDTWFSSGLLPVSVFGWPFADGKPSEDFAAFYPTSLLVTGFDILFFWVARMIMLGCWFSADVPMPDGSARPLAESVPFRDVYIHALVRDAHGDKMSKTKGNVVDPIETVRAYGTDAVRFTLASMASPGTDIAFNVARTEGYRAFANKIWNAARFVFLNMNRAADAGIRIEIASRCELPEAATDAPLEDRWIVAELHRATAAVDAALTEYRFDEAAQSLYSFFWGSFCDWYLEMVKIRLQFGPDEDREQARAALQMLVAVLEAALRLLSPFMPFLTEEIWHALYDNRAPERSIALAPYPKSNSGAGSGPGRVATHDPAAQDSSLLSMLHLQSFITETRALRKEIGIEEKAEAPVLVRTEAKTAEMLQQNSMVVRRLARVQELRFCDALPAHLAARSTAAFDLAIDFQRTVDVAAERERLSKEIARLEKSLTSADTQLQNAGFLSKAPQHVVEGLRSQRADSELLLAKSRQALAAL